MNLVRLSSVAGLIGSEEGRDREMLFLARLWIASRLPGPAGPDALRLKDKEKVECECSAGPHRVMWFREP